MSTRVTQSVARTFPARSAPTPAQSLPYPQRSVPFPADLIDCAMPALTDTEWRLLCVVVRQTLGWHSEDGGRKARDWLTQAQLAGRAGRSRRAVSGAVEGLVRKGIIRVQTEAGEPLETPAARRGYGGRHWFLLRSEPADGQPLGTPNGATTNGATTNGATTNGATTNGATTNGATTNGATTNESTAGGINESTAGGIAESSQGRAPFVGGGAKSAEKYLPITKESPDKTKSFSGGEPPQGSPPENALLSEKSTREDNACEKRTYEETAQAAGEASQPESLPEGESQAEKSGAGAGYLRQLVQDESVDYDEVRRLLLGYQDACLKVFPQQETPTLAWEREGKIVAGLLRQHPYERLLRLLNRFLSQADPSRTDPSRGGLNRTALRQPPQQRTPQQLNYTLTAFAQAVPDMIAQGRQDVGQGVRRIASDFPIRLWREEGAMTIHGATGRVIREEGQKQGSKPQAAKPTGNAATRWTWSKGLEEWRRN